MKNNSYLTDFKEKFQQYSIINVKCLSKDDAKQFRDLEESFDLLQGQANAYTESSPYK
jgi:hypothetical protein